MHCQEHTNDVIKYQVQGSSIVFIIINPRST